MQFVHTPDAKIGRGASVTGTHFRRSIETLSVIMRRRVAAQYRDFISNLRKRCLSAMVKGSKELVHLYYKYPVPSDGYRSIIKIHKFLRDDAKMNVVPIFYNGLEVGIRILFYPKHV